jgi:hypothetical protein
MKLNNATTIRTTELELASHTACKITTATKTPMAIKVARERCELPLIRPMAPVDSPVQAYQEFRPAMAVNMTMPAFTRIPRLPPVAAKVNTAAGTTMEPSRIRDRKELGFLVTSSVRSSSRYAPTPASNTQSQLSRLNTRRPWKGWAASGAAVPERPAAEPTSCGSGV